MSKAKEAKEPAAGAAVKDDRKAKLAALTDKLQKDHGSEIVIMGNAINSNVAAISTGSLNLDLTLGIGGLPKGRIIEIYGPESSGKTTLTLQVIAAAQKAGLMCAFVDAEHALDPKYAGAIGVKTAELLISQPDYGEQAMDVVGTMVESGAVDVIVVDSVAALVPKSEIEGDMEQQSMGVHARMMSKALRKITSIAAKNGVMVIFINQIRMKIGVMYGNPETTTGGNALKFFASVRLVTRAGEKFEDKANGVSGYVMKVKVAKNKVAAPFTECEIPVIYGQGIDKAADTYAAAKELEVFTTKGGGHWMNMPVKDEAGKVVKENNAPKMEEVRLAKSADEMLKRLREEKDLLEMIDKDARQKFKEKFEKQP